MYFNFHEKSCFPPQSFPDKLMPTSAVCTDNKPFENSDIFTKLLTDLSRTLLTEIAHQSLPPSSIPLLKCP